MAADARAIERNALRDLGDPSQYKSWAARRRTDWLDMLGIDDEHLKCDLNVRVTNTHDFGDVRVENLHFQAVPGKRIPCNLWLPRGKGPFPTIVYLCGHGMPGKWSYQNHGRWFARQGYACLAIDAIQIGESEGMHHGMFLHNCRHWVSQGYTPAGVEVQIARRALDYLATRPDTDATRCGLTGISGGATMSLFTAAADERFAAVAPHCIAGTVEQLIVDRSLDSHCDCATWVNLHRMGVTDIAALIAPRPLLLSFSALDALCTPQPMRDMAARLRPVWSMLGKPDGIQTSEDDIPHAYSALICKRILSWFNVHLRGMSADVPDSAVLAFSSRYVEDRSKTIPASKLSAFQGDDPAKDQRMFDVDRTFIRLPGRPAIPDDVKAWNAERDRRLAALRRITFRDIPNPADCRAKSRKALGAERQARYLEQISFDAENGLELNMVVGTPPTPGAAAFMIGPCDPLEYRTRIQGAMGAMPQSVEFGCASVHVRGTSLTSIGANFEWFARRGHPLLGKSMPERQCMDLLRGIRILKQDPRVADVAVYGKASMSAQAIYAALLCEDVSELVLEAPAATHWQAGPEFPGVLRVGDLPANLALFFPRPITFVQGIPLEYDWVCTLYETYGRRSAIRVIPAASVWTPAGK